MCCGKVLIPVFTKAMRGMVFAAFVNTGMSSQSIGLHIVTSE